jgi:hypothetical protein
LGTDVLQGSGGRADRGISTGVAAIRQHENHRLREFKPAMKQDFVSGMRDHERRSMTHPILWGH